MGIINHFQMQQQYVSTSTARRIPHIIRLDNAETGLIAQRKLVLKFTLIPGVVPISHNRDHGNRRLRLRFGFGIRTQQTPHIVNCTRGRNAKPVPFIDGKRRDAICQIGDMRMRADVSSVVCISCSLRERADTSWGDDIGFR